MRRPTERRAAARVLLLLPVTLVAAVLAAVVPRTIASADGNESPDATIRVQQNRLATGSGHTCAILYGGTLKCWGLNQYGQLGYGDTTSRGANPGDIAALPAIDLGTTRKAVQVTAGTFHTCALLDNAKVKCWGLNFEGELGLGDILTRGDQAGEMGDSLPYVNLGTGRTAKMIAADEDTTCAILDNNKVKCWGDNTYGQLGYGDTNFRGVLAGQMGDALPYVDLGAGRTAVQIATGSATCAVLDNNRLKCWGSSDWGQLGYGDITRRGDGPGEMGDALPYVDLGTNRTAREVVTGRLHTCALLDNGTTKCWGDSTNGESARGDTVLTGNEPGEMGDNLPPSNWGTGRTVKALTASSGRTCAILDDDTLKCVGLNDKGQAGQGDTASRGGAAGTTGDNLAAVAVGSGRTVSAVSASRYHTCAILDDDAVKCWGLNQYGQLGYDDASDRGDGANELGDNLLGVALVTNPTNRFVPVNPQRLFDTRVGPDPFGLVPPGGTISVQVSGKAGIPSSGVTAVVMNVTTTGTLAPGYVTVYPAHVRRPLASNLNVERAGQTIPNLVTVRLSPEGKVNLYTTAGGHLLADVAGYYTPSGSTTAGRFVSVSPFRLLDTRNPPIAQKMPAGSTLKVPVSGVSPLPGSGMAAVALNVTATQVEGEGYVTVFPGGNAPLASNLNLSYVGQTIPNMVIVPVALDGYVYVYTTAKTHIVIDVMGYFTDSFAATSSSGLFVSLSPTRLLDTRVGPKPVAEISIPLMIASRAGVPGPSGVKAANLNVTGTEPAGIGHVTVFPTGQPLPIASTLNFDRVNQTIPNHAIAPLSSGSVSLFPSVDAHLVVDLNGYYT